MPTATDTPDGTTVIGPPPDRWRYTCPNGHTTWDRTNGGWWCQRCAAATTHNPDVDPKHDHLVDQKTGRRLSRGDVEYAADGPTL